MILYQIYCRYISSDRFPLDKLLVWFWIFFTMWVICIWCVLLFMLINFLVLFCSLAALGRATVSWGLSWKTVPRGVRFVSYFQILATYYLKKWKYGLFLICYSFLKVIVSGKLRAQRAKSMKFKDGYMISSGQPVKEYIDSAVRHVLLRQVWNSFIPLIFETLWIMSVIHGCYWS